MLLCMYFLTKREGREITIYLKKKKKGLFTHTILYTTCCASQSIGLQKYSFNLAYISLQSSQKCKQKQGLGLFGKGTGSLG